MERKDHGQKQKQHAGAGAISLQSDFKVISKKLLFFHAINNAVTQDTEQSVNGVRAPLSPTHRSSVRE